MAQKFGPAGRPYVTTGDERMTSGLAALAFVFGAALTVTVLLPQVGAAQVTRAAYFDDGQDKTSIPELRAARDRGQPLTVAEEAILRAANRTGYVRFPDCTDERGVAVNGNAFLVRIGGRDAVVTSAHIAMDLVSRQFRNGCTLAELTRILYMPNASYFDRAASDPPPRDDDPIAQTIGGLLDTSLGRLDVQGVAPSTSSDYIVMLLDEQISHLPSPDGAVRGAFEFAVFPRQGDVEVAMLGVDPSYIARSGRVSMTWQTCLAEVNFGRTRHLCDTVPGVSGSVIAVFEDGDYRALALHSGGVDGAQTDAPLPLPSSRFGWNTATTTSVIVDALRVQGR